VQKDFVAKSFLFLAAAVYSQVIMWVAG